MAVDIVRRPRRAYVHGMNDSPQDPRPEPEAPGGAPGKTLPPAARRALEVAAARRAAQTAAAAGPAELGGPQGPEPTRYGDWERKGLAVDF
jgi:hypothetical protein